MASLLLSMIKTSNIEQIPFNLLHRKTFLACLYWVRLIISRRSDSSKQPLKGQICYDSHIFITHLIGTFNPLARLKKIQELAGWIRQPTLGRCPHCAPKAPGTNTLNSSVPYTQKKIWNQWPWFPSLMVELYLRLCERAFSFALSCKTEGAVTWSCEYQPSLNVVLGPLHGHMHDSYPGWPVKQFYFKSR